MAAKIFKRLRRAQLRGLVRDYCVEYITENPGATNEEAIPAVKDRIRGDFGSSPWVEILLVLVEVLLPILLELLGKNED